MDTKHVDQAPPSAPADKGAKEKNLEQLAAARAKAKAKRIEKEKRLEKLEEAFEARTIEPKAPVEAAPSKPAKRKAPVQEDSSSSEDEEPQAKRKPVVVTKQPAPKPEPEGPSFLDEVKKTALIGALSLASFYVANSYSKRKEAPAAPPEVAAPELTTVQFPKPAPKPQAAPFARPEPKTPVGKSGFFR